jgi:serine/threonine protein kinase
LDFGLVKDLGASDSSSSIESNMVGTPQYISPEAVHTPEKVGPAADLYAVGAVGYYLITGRPLFESATLLDMLSQHLDRPPVPPSARLGRAVPPKLESVILQCLEKDPARRPARAEVLGDALEAAVDDTGPWTPEDAHSWWDRWRAGPRSAAGTIATPMNLTDAPTLQPGDDFPAVIRSAS